MGAGPPCTYCPNLRSKFHHYTPKLPSNSLKFFHHDLDTEHSSRIKRYCACVTIGYGNQSVMGEWQAITMLFGGKMVEF